MNVAVYVACFAVGAVAGVFAGAYLAGLAIRYLSDRGSRG